MRRARCRFHCSLCWGHFGSLEAFEAHRVGSFADGTRRCGDPLDDPRFSAKSEDGACLMYAGRERYGVTVWTLARSLERRNRLDGLGGKGSQGADGAGQAPASAEREGSYPR